MPGHALFISDLHLQELRPDLTQAFLDFLARQAAGAEALYILGDFFNVWIGDDHVTDLSKTVSAALTELAMGGTGIYLMHGNRDFLLGRDFAQGCHARLITEPYLLDCRGSQYLLLHGDALCTRDTDYMEFRRMVRDDAWQRRFLASPLEQRQHFADQARARSKAMSSNKAEDITDVTPAEVESLMREHRVATLIHGHTHRPAVHEMELDGAPVRRIVLGDWDERGWYLRVSEQGEELLSFAIAG